VAEEDRLLYKDENVPAIVSEELWERANAILERRSAKFRGGERGAQSRFSYSGKIKCGEHGAYHYRKVWKDRKTPAESWCCREYLAKGRKGCATPHIYTRDLDAILRYVGNGLFADKEKLAQGVDKLVNLYAKAEKGAADFQSEIAKLNKELDKTKAKQEKILELHMDGDMEKAAYVEMNGRLKTGVEKLNKKLDALREDQLRAGNAGDALARARKFLFDLCDSGGGVLDAAREMLEEAVALPGGSQKDIRLIITMKHGAPLPCSVVRPFTLYGETEISPIVGSEKQSEELIAYLAEEMESDPAKIWELNMFGKSMHDMVKEGLHNKLYRMPEDAQMKLQETLQKIINEGSGGLICIIL